MTLTIDSLLEPNLDCIYINKIKDKTLYLMPEWVNAKVLFITNSPYWSNVIFVSLANTYFTYMYSFCTDL